MKKPVQQQHREALKWTCVRYLWAAIALLPAVTALASPDLDWDADRAVLAGSGCTKDIDAFVLLNGKDISVVLTNLGINLPGMSGSPLAARSACSIRIPATIATGYYVSELRQHVTYGVTKTSRTRGSISTRSTFFGFPVSPLTIGLNYGVSMNSPYYSQSRQDRFSASTTPSWYNGWCSRNRAPRGLFQANIAVSGQKDSQREDLIVSIVDFDSKYDVDIDLNPCI